MNYENSPCPCCGAHLHEEDDIVVCPECATPQHRSCWMENGHCINADKHASGYVWQPDASKQADNTFDFSQQPAQPDTVICHICGSENPADSTHCGSCGAVLGKMNEFINKNMNVEAPVSLNINIDGTELTEHDRIGGYSVGDFVIYLKTSVTKYLTRFKRMEEGKKVSFNWAAFFLGPLWYFFRKLYIQGGILIAVMSAITLIFNSVMNAVTNILLPYQEQITNGTLSQEKMAELIMNSDIDLRPITVGMLLLFAVNIVSGFMANSLYYKKIRNDFEILGQQVPDEHMRRMLITRRGGVSILSAFCGYFAFDAVCTLMTYIAEFVADKL